MKEFGIRNVQIGSVSIISIAKAKLSGIVDTTESKLAVSMIPLKVHLHEIFHFKLVWPKEPI
jgi:hypothetical protein